MFIKMSELLGIRLIPVFFGILKLERYRPTQLHINLEVIGVEKNFRGKGIATSLISSVLCFCDIYEIPVFLIASTDKNASLYEKLGFSILDEIKVPLGPVLRPMIYNPQNPNGDMKQNVLI